MWRFGFEGDLTTIVLQNGAFGAGHLADVLPTHRRGGGRGQALCNPIVFGPLYSMMEDQSLAIRVCPLYVLGPRRQGVRGWCYDLLDRIFQCFPAKQRDRNHVRRCASSTLGHWWWPARRWILHHTSRVFELLCTPPLSKHPSCLPIFLKVICLLCVLF